MYKPIEKTSDYIPAPWMVLLSVVLFLFPINAEDTLFLTLDEAVSYALTHNKSIVNSKLEIEKSVFKVKEVISQGLPQINASLDYSNYMGAEASLQINPMLPPAKIEFEPTSNFNLKVSQLLFNGSYYVSIQLTKIAENMAKKSLIKDELNVKEQTIKAYYTILVSERLQEIIKSNKKNIESVYEKTKNLADAGVIEQTDVKKLSIMIASLDNALKSNERQVELGYNLLRLQLGLSSDKPIHLISPLDKIIFQKISQPINDIFDISRHIDYELLSLQTELAGKNVLMRKVSFLPSLVGFYSYTNKLKSSKFDLTPDNVVGLSLSLPIFSGGQRHFLLKQAETDYQISQKRKEILAQQLELQEKQLRYNFNNLLDQYLTQKNNLEIAREVLDKMELKYQQGLISSLELNSANNDYLSAESNYTALMLQLLNAELELRKINGRL